MARLTLSNVQPVAQTSQILAHAPARHASIPAHVPQFPPHPFGPHVLPVQSGLHVFFFLFFRFRRFFFLFFLFFLASTSVAPNSAPVASAARDSPNSPCATVRRPKNPASARAKRSNGGCTWSGLPEPSGDGLGLRAKIGGERRFAMAGRSYEDCTLLATGTGDEDIVRVIRDPVNGANPSGERIPHRSRSEDLP
jgi:hypothetical protein